MAEKQYKQLAEKGIEFTKGLSDKEITEIEEYFHFRFPPDLREFLQFAMPIRYPGHEVGKYPAFPNWRDLPSPNLAFRISDPLQGILFDIERNNFWLEEWGLKPTELEKAKDIATKMVETAPKLIPIYGHRYLPAQPSISDNPIFSVQQTDIIYCGVNLDHYLWVEFGIDYFVPPPQQARKIDFWSSVAELNGASGNINDIPRFIVTGIVYPQKN